MVDAMNSGPAAPLIVDDSNVIHKSTEFERIKGVVRALGTRHSG